MHPRLGAEEANNLELPRSLDNKSNPSSKKKKKKKAYSLYSKKENQKRGSLAKWKHFRHELIALFQPITSEKSVAPLCQQRASLESIFPPSKGYSECSNFPTRWRSSRNLGLHSHLGCNKEPHRLKYQQRSSGELGLVTLSSSSEAAASSLALMEQH